ncbi:cation efflux family-domain-containing protein [Schizophyllum amplum]|uniref:Cation efflux family-domain-containing protein n=1 Tax=Schizophyllum amplum TaxID=97359 RepID=A0A550CLD5_9AGAR|nr:cation efflux family-domain-containing protein [Auriculariopsis ampla]
MKTTTRLGIVLGISLTFFVAEIAGRCLPSALLQAAEADLCITSRIFHYLNAHSAIAFLAAYLQDNGHSSLSYTFAYHRAELVGAFFNGVFLLALALSIFLQSIERFINIAEVEEPVMVLIIGCIGLALNIISVLVVHDHAGHSHGGHASEAQGPGVAAAVPSHIHEGHNHTLPITVTSVAHGHSHGNLGIAGVVVHLLGDAVNSPLAHRFYADPAASLLISLIIFSSAIPLTMKSGRILLEAAPLHLDLEKIKDDLSTIPNVLSIHDLHVWHSLNRAVILASVHVCVSPALSMVEWQETEHYLQQCFTEFGVGHVTISPELHDSESPTVSGGDLIKTSGIRKRREGSHA